MRCNKIAYVFIIHKLVLFIYSFYSLVLLLHFAPFCTIMLCYFAEIILGRVQQRHVSMASQRLEWSKQGVVRIADTTKCDK